MKIFADKNILDGIRRLLERSSSQSSKVVCKASELLDAGNGVFNNRNESIQVNEVLTLYPGLYVPPPPIFFTGTDELPLVSLNNSPLYPNCDYVINSSYGGYIDAANENDDDERFIGHLINHPSNKKANVEAIHFQWNKVFKRNTEENQNKACTYLPADNEDWYLDPNTAKIYKYPKKYSDTYWYHLKGIAIISIKTINPHEELKLDYELRNYVNVKGREWYKPSIK